MGLMALTPSAPGVPCPELMSSDGQGKASPGHDDDDDDGSGGGGREGRLFWVSCMNLNTKVEQPQGKLDDIELRWRKSQRNDQHPGQTLTGQLEPNLLPEVSDHSDR